MKLALNPLSLALMAGLLFSAGAYASPELEQQVRKDAARSSQN